MIDRLVARYRAKHAGFVPIKFFQAKKKELVEGLKNKNTFSYIHDLYYWLETFERELKAMGLHPVAAQAVKEYVKDIRDDLEEANKRQLAFDAKLATIPYKGDNSPSAKLASLFRRLIEDASWKVYGRNVPAQLKSYPDVDIPALLATASRLANRMPQEDKDALVKEDEPWLYNLNAKARAMVENAIPRLWVKVKHPRVVDVPARIDFIYKILAAKYTEKAKEEGDLLWYRDFSIGKLRVIVKEGYGVELIANAEAYAQYFMEAKSLLERKGFGKLWYGVFFLGSTSYDKLSPAAQEAYQQYGYTSLESTAGTYHDGDDTVKLTIPPRQSVVDTIVHEMGHRYWYKFMRSDQRARFNDLVRTNTSEKTREYPSGPYRVRYNPEAPLVNIGKVKKEAQQAFDSFQTQIYKLLFQEGDDLLKALVSQLDGLRDAFERSLRAILPTVPGVDFSEAETAIYSTLATLEGIALYSKEELASLSVTRWYLDWSKDHWDAYLLVTQYLDKVSDTQGEIKPVSAVSDYGAGSIEEAFAEVFERYVMEESLNRDQLESFRSVLSSLAPDENPSLLRVLG